MDELGSLEYGKKSKYKSSKRQQEHSIYLNLPVSSEKKEKENKNTKIKLEKSPVLKTDKVDINKTLDEMLEDIMGKKYSLKSNLIQKKQNQDADYDEINMQNIINNDKTSNKITNDAPKICLKRKEAPIPNDAVPENSKNPNKRKRTFKSE